MQTGTQQDQRLAAALRPGYILPDEITLAERIRLTLAYAGELRFASDDGDAGHWDEALLRDESVLLAELASFPLDAAQASFSEAWPWTGERHLWLRVRRLLQRFDRWCQWLARHETPSATQVSQAMMAAIGTGLRDMLHEAIRCFGLESREAQELHPAWRVNAQVTATAASTVSADQRLQLLRRLWGALCMAITKLRPLAQAQLSLSLSNGKHEPAMGLLLSALRLYQDTRAAVNRFPDRLTDFYYLDLLRMRARAPTTEQVYLRFQRDPRFRASVPVPRGTCFLGGKDAQGKAIEFAADQAIEVTDNQVAALYSLRMERDALISPEREFGYATRLMSQALPLQAPEAAYAESPAWWPLLGGQVKGSASKAQNAVLGFAIASPMLALKEGDRRISITLRLSHPANDDDKLATLLRCTSAQRGPDWLATVFGCFDRYETRHHPVRKMRDQTLATDQLASEAWARAARTEGDVQLCYLLARCLAAADSELFCACLGRLFAVWLTAASEELHPADVDALRAHAAKLSIDGPEAVEIDDPLILIHHHEHDDGVPEHDMPDRGLIFARVFRGIWQAQLSVAAGWLSLSDALVRRIDNGNTGPGGCIEILLHLGLEQPPIVSSNPVVHGPGWPSQPLLCLSLQRRTRLYAYSLLQQLVLHDIVVGVDVHGIRDIVLYNQLGRLDAGKPFLPFGPMPGMGAYCVFGNQEIAAKPLRSLRLRLRWGQLPTGEGGFAEHYRGYPGQWTAAGFQVQPEILRDGQWRVGAGGGLSLFHGEHRVADRVSLVLPEADLAVYHRPQSRMPDPFTYGMNTRNGFFRLELSAPGTAFGHAVYPRLLTDTLTRNARLKRARLASPLPQEPYTPTIEQISLDYSASELISLKAAATPSAGQLFHLHPFGHDNPRSRAGIDGVPLLPRYFHDGSLYLGLSGSDPQGALSLFFHLRAESAAESWHAVRPQLTWAVWCEDGWRGLETDRLLSDGTLGFLRSGIVVLDLPAGMSDDCPRLPQRLYWLRLSGNGGLERLAGLYGIYTQAISASRVHPRGVDESRLPLLPGTVRTPWRAIGGLSAVQQIGPSFGLREPDVGDALRIRSAERLRHKQRASTTWDYERLLLDNFPETFKVKCFANGEAPSGPVSGPPGGVLVVVVPAPRQGVLFHSTEAPRFDAAVLEQMATYLNERNAPGIRIVVRNAVYERIQVRCALQLVKGCHPGAALQRINQAIVTFLSPWHTEGRRANFDWEVRAEAIEACLRDLDEVDVVGPMSLLHIVCTDDNTYHLRDTARSGDASPVRHVRPAQPWSLALPTSRHLIEVIGVDSQGKAQATGVGKLEIGGTFILGGTASAERQGTP